MTLYKTKFNYLVSSKLPVEHENLLWDTYDLLFRDPFTAEYSTQEFMASVVDDWGERMCMREALICESRKWR